MEEHTTDSRKLEDILKNNSNINMAESTRKRLSDFDVEMLSGLVKEELKTDSLEGYFFKNFIEDVHLPPYNLEGRFELMKKQYEAAPKYIVKPILAVKVNGEKEKISGYILEKLSGITLHEAINNDLVSSYNYSIPGELNTAIKELNRRGCVHGDIHPSNIILTETGIKLIDSLYVVDGQKYDRFFEMLRERDVIMFKALKKTLQVAANGYFNKATQDGFSYFRSLVNNYLPSQDFFSFKLILNKKDLKNVKGNLPLIKWFITEDMAPKYWESFFFRPEKESFTVDEIKSVSAYKDLDHFMKEKFTYMKNLHDICPDKVVSPIKVMLPASNCKGGYKIGEKYLSYENNYSFKYKSNLEKIPGGYIVEGVEGESLYSALEKGHINNYKNIFEQVNETIQKLHSNGYAYGDLNDRKIMLTRHGIKLLDIFDSLGYVVLKPKNGILPLDVFDCDYKIKKMEALMVSDNSNLKRLEKTLNEYKD